MEGPSANAVDADTPVIIAAAIMMASLFFIMFLYLPFIVIFPFHL
jgi:hypothetical protein